MKVLAAAFAGARVAFLISSTLSQLLSAYLPNSYTFISWLYKLGLIRTGEASAGSFPNGGLFVFDRILLLLADICLALAAVTFFLARTKKPT
ncbi:hypothetical protein Dxin01_00269 [Deinococcus xinjiangensis]|uniref:Uncharacterized protein n=1 Tax=Deinococcus xinjiangensis TaxID=457454 RepID=A0ABP9V5I6_9DEIO